MINSWVYAEGAGDVLQEVGIKAQSFVPFHRLEIVLNGQVVAFREATSGTREMTLAEKIRIPGPGWLAARCSSQLGPVTSWQFMMQAHTSPVYLVLPGQELFSPRTAAYMLALIDGSQAFVEELAIRPDPERLARVLQVFEDARARLHRQLHEHGASHQGPGFSLIPEPRRPNTLGRGNRPEKPRIPMVVCRGGRTEANMSSSTRVTWAYPYNRPWPRVEARWPSDPTSGIQFRPVDPELTAALQQEIADQCKRRMNTGWNDVYHFKAPPMRPTADKCTSG